MASAPTAPNPRDDQRPIVLVLLGAFWPGHESAGPNQSFVSLCQALGAEFRFKVLARDRPFGPGPAVAPSGRWIDLGYAEARYLPTTHRRVSGLARALRETPHDALVMNGFFDREFTIPALVMRKLGLVPRKPTLLSPRGEFAGGALGLKSARKRAYLGLARRLGLLGDVWLHATAPEELADIRAGAPPARGVILAPIVRALPDLPARPEAETSADGPVRLAFVARISPLKNLDYALRLLAGVGARVDFDIYGPVSDPAHWSACRRIIASLPERIRVTHRGEIANSAVPETLARYDLFFLPTRGENFGHAIFEALASGLPTLISDRTPWQDLEAQEAGWNLPLDRPEGFAEAIDRYAAMGAGERARLRHGARRAAETMVARSDAAALSRAMLRTLLSGEPTPGQARAAAREEALS